MAPFGQSWPGEESERKGKPGFGSFHEPLDESYVREVVVQPTWNESEKSLPEPYQLVLMYYKNINGMRTGWFHFSCDDEPIWVTHERIMDTAPSHWMKLPDKP